MKNPPLRMGAAALLLAALVATATATPGQVLKGSTPQSLDRSGAVRELPPQMTARYQKTIGMLQPSARAWIEQQGRREAQQPAPDAESIRAAVKARFGRCDMHSTAATSRVNAAGAGASAASGGPITSMAGGCPAPADVEELAFLVMMEAARDAENDLRQIMQQAKELEKEKDSFRKQIEGIRQAESNLKAALAAKGRDAANRPCDLPDCRSLVEMSAHLSAMTARSSRPLRYNASGAMSLAQALQLADKMKKDMDAMGDLSQEQQMKMQQAMERRSKMEAMISNLMKKMSETQSSIIGNLK